jgi:hypothetical protein
MIDAAEEAGQLDKHRRLRSDRIGVISQLVLSQGGLQLHDEKTLWKREEPFCIVSDHLVLSRRKPQRVGSNVGQEPCNRILHTRG